jgi:hypothetical protein
MGFGKVVKTGLALYGMNELIKKQRNKRAGNNRNPYQQEMDRQDEYEYDRYCYGEDDSF